LGRFVFFSRSNAPAWECLPATPSVAEGGMHTKRNAERWNEVKNVSLTPISTYPSPSKFYNPEETNSAILTKTKPAIAPMTDPQVVALSVFCSIPTNAPAIPPSAPPITVENARVIAKLPENNIWGREFSENKAFNITSAPTPNPPIRTPKSTPTNIPTITLI